MSTAKQLTTHQRKCHDCGTTNDHLSDITPGVCCPKCGSQDTRRVKTSEDRERDEKRVREQAWEIVGKVEWSSEDWQTFHEYLSKAFMIIAARHARERIGGK